MGDPESTDTFAAELANLVSRVLERGATVDEVRAVLGDLLEELEAEAGNEEESETSHE